MDQRVCEEEARAKRKPTATLHKSVHPGMRVNEEAEDWGMRWNADHKVGSIGNALPAEEHMSEDRLDSMSTCNRSYRIVKGS